VSQGAVRRAPRDKVFGCAAAVVTLLCLLLASPGHARGVYAASFNSHDLAVIDSRTNLLAGPPISLPNFVEPFTLAITPDGSRAYVSNSNGDSLLTVDLRTNAVIGAPIPLDGDPNGIAITPDGGRVYVANSGAESVSAIDIRTNQKVGGPIQVGRFPNGIAITPDGRRVYVCNEGSASVSVIDTQTNQQIAAIPVQNSPRSVAVTPDGSRAYVVNQGSHTVSVIDTQANQVIGQPIDVDLNSANVSISPDGNRVYVTNPESGTISVIDRATNARLPDMTGLVEPEFFALTADGRVGYVSTFEPGRVTPVSALNGQAVGPPVDVGQATGQVVVSPDQPPVASFAFGRPRPGVPVGFDASGSKDSDGTVATYAWAFGDGTTAASSSQTSHVFAKSGNYRVTLTLTDNEGCSTSLVFTGQTAYCNGSAVATQTSVVRVAYPGVRVRCPKRAKPAGCRFKLRVLSKRGKRAKALSAVARVRVRPGKSAIASLKPKKAFRSRLAQARTVLVEKTQTTNGSTRTTVRRLKIVQ
jgi:YVTN family beta-propeller protein